MPILRVILILVTVHSACFAQGAFTPDVDYEKSFPRLLFKKDQLEQLREKWQIAETLHPTLYYTKRRLQQYSETTEPLADWSGYEVYKKSSANAFYASAAAFRYAMSPTDRHSKAGDDEKDEFGEII